MSDFEQFEKWALDNQYEKSDLSKHADGEYVFDYTAYLYAGWQAAIASMQGEAVANPYPSTGVPHENWQRGYDGIRFIGVNGSDAHKFYMEGVSAKRNPPSAASKIAEQEARIAELEQQLEVARKDAERLAALADFERTVAGGKWSIQVIDSKGGMHMSYFDKPPKGEPDVKYISRLDALRAAIDAAIRQIGGAE